MSERKKNPRQKKEKKKKKERKVENNELFSLWQSLCITGKDPQIWKNYLFFHQVGWFANPIFGEEGDYPEIMIEQIEENSGSEGLFRSRLPEFDNETLDWVKGNCNFSEEKKSVKLFKLISGKHYRYCRFSRNKSFYDLPHRTSQKPYRPRSVVDSGYSG